MSSAIFLKLLIWNRIYFSCTAKSPIIYFLILHDISEILLEAFIWGEESAAPIIIWVNPLTDYRSISDKHYDITIHPSLQHSTTDPKDMTASFLGINDFWKLQELACIFILHCIISVVYIKDMGHILLSKCLLKKHVCNVLSMWPWPNTFCNSLE